MLPNNLGRLQRLNKKSLPAQSPRQHGKIFPRCLKFLGRLENIYIYSSCPKKSSMSPPIPGALSSQESTMQHQQLLGTYKGDNFNLLKSFQGVKLTSLFHADLIPNLGKLKIFSPRVKIAQHIYQSLNQNAMSFAKSNF